MKHTISLILSVLTLSAVAQNPIIHDQFTADPTARVFNGKIYLYPSHDIPAPVGKRQDWFCMEDYHVFSSENLIDWTDHGIIVSQTTVPWGKPDGYSMWAPDCVCKNGRYYFYFPNAPKEGRGFAIGVATADKPEGPFICENRPIVGVSGIDPCVLLDDDGNAYLYWSGMGIRGSKLKDNMKELDGELQEVTMPGREGMPPIKVGGVEMKGLPEGFKEGPFVFKREDHYYLTFPWVRQEGGTETLAYAMSDNPLGPWTFKGIIMAEHLNRCWTNHHSIVEYHGEWLLFYHHNDYSPRFDKMRSAHIDRICFNPDGTIQEVKPTLRGVGICDAATRLEVDRYSMCSEDVNIAFNDSLNTFRGWYLSLPRKGSWSTYADVDFASLSQSLPENSVKGDVYLVANVRANEDATLVVRDGSIKGKEIARLPIQVESTGQRHRSVRGQWITLTAPLKYLPKGITSLFLITEGAGIDVDWLQFKKREQYFNPVANKAISSQPDADGFIRRWLLLEPLDKPNRSNTVFTDTYLQDAFAAPPFHVEPRFVLPKDGQKIKVNKQTLAWHALDSQHYNVKLFRFADQLGMQTYGVLFWAVTVIDCTEDISNIRLAAGSNGASKWWLNGEEILLLSGDRRMVRDDGVSSRLTLKKGRNILRCAVINGPGMSDFCVRFIDEHGNPVRNYQVNCR